MALSPSQKTTLKADILALNASGQPLEGTVTAQYWDVIADYYNTITATSGWNTVTPAKSIIDAIDWTKYTPSDAATDTTTVYMNRASAIQIKQMNLQNILLRGDYIDASKAGIRAGLRDATIQIPSGASGANTNPGGTSGATVLTACTRLINRIELLFGSSTATTGSTTANILTFEGKTFAQEISDVMTL